MKAFRPRIIYCPLFAWNAITGGKFIAPLLQQISPTFSDATVGMTLSIQYSMVAILAGWGGRLADGEERKVRKIRGEGSPAVWGWGRLKVTSVGLLIGTMAFLGHELPRYLSMDKDALPDNQLPMDKGALPDNQLIYGVSDWNFELLWHIFMRMLWAASFALTAPSVDGLALDHLDCIENASQMDFGIERMYGAIWWGVGSLIAGMGIDRYGFAFLYVMAVLCAVATYCGIGLYLWSLKRDTTGSFELRVVIIDHDVDSEEIRGVCQEDSLSDSRTNENGVNNQTTKDEEKISSRELFLMLCRTHYGAALVLFIFTFATGISVVDNLAFLFFDFLGSSSTMDGWTVVFTVVFEVPLFYMSPYLLKRYGPGKLLLAAGLAYIIRVVGYTLVPMGDMWIILPLELLHGISYACSKTGSVEYVARIMPKGYEASGQGILFVLRFIGVVVGLGSAGWTQELYGPRIMYGLMACVVSFGWVVLFFAEICTKEELRDSGKNNQINIDGGNEPNENDGLIRPNLDLADGKMKYDSITQHTSESMDG